MGESTDSQTKSAIRELATPIASVPVFNLIVQSVITDNPFGLCCLYDRRCEPRPG